MTTEAKMTTSTGKAAVWPVKHHYIDEISNTQHWTLAETWACAMDKLNACAVEHYSYLSSTDATGAYVYDVL